MKKYIIGFILGIILMAGLGVIASSLIDSDKIGYGNGTVKDKLDYLYTAPQVRKFCEYKNSTYGDSSNHYSVGTMYECDPGDGVKRNFYILAVNNEKIELIMDRNITQDTATSTMTWNNAMKYIDNNMKTTWANTLDVDLPKAQAIANAVGNSSWKASDNNAWWCLETKTKDTTSSPYCYNNTQKTLWLWDYTKECSNWHCGHSLGSNEANGYWTRDLISNSDNAWDVREHGDLDNTKVSIATYYGVRPVITILKSNLYE